MSDFNEIVPHLVPSIEPRHTPAYDSAPAVTVSLCPIKKENDLRLELDHLFTVYTRDAQVNNKMAS